MFRLEDMWDASHHGGSSSSLNLLKQRLARYRLPWRAHCTGELGKDARTWLPGRVFLSFDVARHKSQSLYYSQLNKLYRREEPRLQQFAYESPPPGSAGEQGGGGTQRKYNFTAFLAAQRAAAQGSVNGSQYMYRYTAEQAERIKTEVNLVAEHSFEARWGYVRLG